MSGTSSDDLCSFLNSRVTLILEETVSLSSPKSTKFDPRRLQWVLSEVQESDWAGFFVVKDQVQELFSSRSLWNLIQLSLESISSEKWIWWPFQPPKNFLRDEEARIFWLCPCGDERWAEVPLFFAIKLEKLLFEHEDLYREHLRQTVSPSEVSYDYLDQLRLSMIRNPGLFPADWLLHLNMQTVLLSDAMVAVYVVKLVAESLKEYLYWRTTLRHIFIEFLLSILSSNLSRLLSKRRPYVVLSLTLISRHSISLYYQHSRWLKLYEPSARQYFKAVDLSSLVLQGCLVLYYAFRRQTHVLVSIRVFSIQTASELLLLCILQFNLYGNMIAFFAWALAERFLWYTRAAERPSELTPPSSQDVNSSVVSNIGVKDEDSVTPSVAATGVPAPQIPLQALTNPSQPSRQSASPQPGGQPPLEALQGPNFQQGAIPHGNVGNLATTTARQSPASLDPRTFRVFLVVTCGRSYKLAQLLIDQQVTTNQFFQDLKSQYVARRGRFRQIFSVWRYSHCDFYSFNKFEAKSYEPQKEDFPLPQMAEYEYSPRPVVSIPPIGPHEFYKRFHASYNPPRFWHILGFRPNAHNRSRLACLPKRELSIIEDSDQFEVFWGIYARERPSFAGLLMYNFIFVIPCIVFIFMWLFGWGHVTDLQNATVPITVMVGGLSVFWSIFLSSFNVVEHK